MHNIRALEEQWRRYDRKRKMPWYILGIIVALLVSVTGWMYYEGGSFEDLLPKRSEAKSSEPAVKVQRKIFVDTALTEIEEKLPETKQDTPVDVLVEESDASSDYGSKRKRKKIHIEVIDVGSGRESLKEIEKRFRLGHDSDDSLFLAKSYYKKGNYKKAEYWALQTNKINENIEESWLIFAKAKAKRGRRNEAIRILNAYIKRTRSVEAKVLVDKIKKGKI